MFNKHLPQMLKAVHSVYRSVGGDLEEMKASLYLRFQKAVQNYKKEKNKSFSAYLYQVVWHDIYSERRIELDRRRRVKFCSMEPTFDAAERPRFELSLLLDDLGDSAKMVVNFCLTAEGIPVTKEGVPKQSSMLAAIKKQFNWTKDELNIIIEEIRQCLK